MQYRVVWDQMETCPYLSEQVARLPLRMPLGAVSPDEFDRLLDGGERRSGRMVYRTQCPACQACEPLRVPVSRFRPTPSQRRVLRRNEADVRVEMGPPAATAERLRLYNRHKLERGLAEGDESLSEVGYRTWLVDSCVDTREVRYFVEKRLVAVSILDFGRTSASSVYHFFDPDESARSLGVYSVLREIELCAQAGIEWYYLGFYVRDCSRLAYKATYWPHQRRVGGVWTEFEK
jgi:leucyl-tRNA---protein transferase